MVNICEDLTRLLAGIQTERQAVKRWALHNFLCGGIKDNADRYKCAFIHAFVSIIITLQCSDCVLLHILSSAHQ